MERINAVGRRKAAIARVYVNEGNGEIKVNKRSLTEYFPNPILQFIVKQPLNTLEAVEKYDITVNLKGRIGIATISSLRSFVMVLGEMSAARRKSALLIFLSTSNFHNLLY